jgi:hypothetical protein
MIMQENLGHGSEYLFRDRHEQLCVWNEGVCRKSVTTKPLKINHMLTF